MLRHSLFIKLLGVERLTFPSSIQPLHLLKVEQLTQSIDRICIYRAQAAHWQLLKSIRAIYI